MAQSNTSINQYDDLRKEVAQRYEQLHPDLKTALVSVDTAGAVYEIGKKFGLDIEQTGYLADVIGYTIIGLLPVADFVYNLKDTIGIDSAKASEIAREVNNKIFLAIRARLKEMHGEKWDERAMLKQEVSITKSVLRDETTKQEVSIKEQEARTTPKSPWEIKPDGLQKKAPEIKSVIPQTKPTTDNLQPTTPPEMLKTREVPQPAPMMRGAEVLREIRPAGAENNAKKQEVSITKPVLRSETTKPQPPTGLPFTQEVEKLTQTPELRKPQEQETASSKEQVTGEAKPQEASSEEQVAKREVSSKGPETRPEVSIKEQEVRTAPQPPMKTAGHYETDPYREPIE